MSRHEIDWLNIVRNANRGDRTCSLLDRSQGRRVRHRLHCGRSEISSTEGELSRTDYDKDCLRVMGNFAKSWFGEHMFQLDDVPVSIRGRNIPV